MKADPRPNIIFIFTDQQSASMMSCAGNSYVNTPAMDSLAASGMRFERAYCTNPVCVPSRFSLMTGRMPSVIGVRSNDHGHVDAVPEHITKQGLGWLFRRAGYDVAYGGKVHLPKRNAPRCRLPVAERPAMTPEDLGFDYLTRDERDKLAEVCAEYVVQDRHRPFLLVVSFINPHDICYMAIRDSAETESERRLLARGKVEIDTLDEALQLPAGASREAFFEQHCPPLPPNFEPQDDEPEAIRALLAQRPFRQKARESWTDERWRLHRWAYARLTEMVDAQIARICDAVRESGKEKDTVIIFSSDHGDMDSAHRMEHKTALYEEACRVPLIISQPGMTSPPVAVRLVGGNAERSAGAVDRTHLVSNGLDLFPTLCDYAGIVVPEELAGLSLRRLAEGHRPASWRDSLPVESEIGRMIVTERYKYVLYDEGEGREQLMDLWEDLGEMRNAAQDAEKAEVLRNLRRLFEKTFGCSI